MAGPALALKGVLVGWGAFCGTHLFLSHTPVRDYLIDKFGEKGFLSAYSAISVGTLAPAAYAYLIGRGRGPVVHTLGDKAIAQYTGAATKWAGFFTTAQGIVNPSPVATKKKYQPNEQVEVTGIHRITRHPVFAGLAMWGLGCMLQRGRLIDMVFWGGFPAFYLLGSLHQDYRYSNAFPRDYWANTSIIPFHAVLTGNQSALKAYEEMSGMSIRMIFFAGILAVALRGRIRREYWYPTTSHKAW
jgi:uncharacterized membrane protein